MKRVMSLHGAMSAAYMGHKIYIDGVKKSYRQLQKRWDAIPYGDGQIYNMAVENENVIIKTYHLTTI